MGLFKYWIWKIYVRWRRLDDTYSIKIRDQVCHVMASLTKTFVSPEIVLQHDCQKMSGPSSQRPTRPLKGHVRHPSWRHFGRMGVLHCESNFEDATDRHSVNGRRQPAGWHRRSTAWELPSSLHSHFISLSLLTLFFTHLWRLWWSLWCSCSGNS